MRSISTCFSRPSCKIPTASHTVLSVSRESSGRIFSIIPRFLLPATTSLRSSSRMLVVTSNSNARPTSKRSERVRAASTFRLNVISSPEPAVACLARHDTWRRVPWEELRRVAKI